MLAETAEWLFHQHLFLLSVAGRIPDLSPSAHVSRFVLIPAAGAAIPADSGELLLICSLC